MQVHLFWAFLYLTGLGWFQGIPSFSNGSKILRLCTTYKTHGALIGCPLEWIFAGCLEEPSHGS